MMRTWPTGIPKAWAVQRRTMCGIWVEHTTVTLPLVSTYAQDTGSSMWQWEMRGVSYSSSTAISSSPGYISLAARIPLSKVKSLSPMVMWECTITLSLRKSGCSGVAPSAMAASTVTMGSYSSYSALISRAA